MAEPNQTSFKRCPRIDALVLFAVAVAWAFFWSSRYSDSSALMNDASVYYQAAIDILQGSQGRLLLRPDGSTFTDIGYPNALSFWFSIAGISVRAGQVLNAALWGISTLFAYGILRSAASRKAAFVGALFFAASPMLTSFSGKLYSEHLAISAGMASLWGFSRLNRPAGWLAFILGGFTLITTKSAFYIFFIVLAGVALINAWKHRRDLKKALPAFALIAVLLAALPIQSRVQKGSRGALQIAAQTAKLELLSYPLIAQCSAYNLSQSLGKKLFPQIEGACRLNGADSSVPLHELNYEKVAFQKIDQGFTYSDGMGLALKSPIKYTLLGASTLLSGFWIEGVYPDALLDSPESVRKALWIFKVLYSTALWLMAALFFWRAVRKGADRDLAILIASPLIFILLFQMNVPGEQRYFFPVIPILYLATALYLTSTGPTGLRRSKSM